ncbi:MAG: hypothetical protein Kow00114_23290 [Kiloniellaceae bacterium]
MTKRHATGNGGIRSAAGKSASRKSASSKSGAGEIPIGLATVSSAPGTAEGQSIEDAIGAQVRALRKRQDMTVAELASQAGLSAGMLSKVENGAISPSLSSLQSLAHALNVPMTSLFADFEQRQDVTYVKAGEGLTIERRGTRSGHQYQLLGHPFPGNFAYEPYLITLTREAEAYANFRHEAWSSSTCWKARSTTATATRSTAWARAPRCSSAPPRRTGPRSCAGCR